MTKRAMIWGVSVAALLLFATIGCVGQDSSPPASGSNDVYSVALAVSTVGNLPSCASALVGTVAHVDSPPSLWRCASGRWTQISCDTSGGGTVAYASTPPTLWACVHSRWTQIALPDAGPPGPAGPPGEAGITPTITVTPEPAGNNCAAGGIRVDVESAGTKSTSYVCNGLSAGEVDAGVDGADADAGPNAIQQYAAAYAQAYCTGFGKCCTGYDIGAFDTTACVAANQVGGWRNVLPFSAAAYTNGHLTLHATQAASCIAAIQNFACSSGTVSPTQFAAVITPCLGVLTGDIPNGSDAGCVSSFECANGYCNVADGGSTGTCTALVATGAPCKTGNDSPDEMCSQAGAYQPMLWCNSFDGSSTGTCASPLPDNSTCYNATTGYWDDYGCSSLLCGDNGCGTTTAAYPDPGWCSGYAPTDAGGGG